MKEASYSVNHHCVEIYLICHDFIALECYTDLLTVTILNMLSNLGLSILPDTEAGHIKWAILISHMILLLKPSSAANYL